MRYIKIFLIFVIISYTANNYVFANEEISDDNTNLSVMRINREGISPDFDKEVKDYYYVSDLSVNKLDITAIPENKDATVKISGNSNLKKGINIVKIEVVSKDKTKKSTYKIYVTKTEDIESANSNLENLAVQESMLYPAFESNITQYKIEVPNNIEKLNILAIPENINANVQIIGNEKLKTGQNVIKINVKAKDGITNKTYIINAYKRNMQEEQEFEEEEKIQAEKLSAILENSENGNEIDENNTHIENKEKPNKWVIGSIFIVFAIIGFIAIWIRGKK